MLAAVYDPNSPSYHHWLTNGQFDARYAPTPAARAAVAKFLSGSGLSVVPSGSPFLVRATGIERPDPAHLPHPAEHLQGPPGHQVLRQLHARLLPSSLAGAALGVVGLTNTVRNASTSKPSGTRCAGPPRRRRRPSCETGYPTKQQLFDFVDNGTNFPSGYGGGPGCSGLTPSQANSIYGAPNLGPRGKGAGVNLAVFELSAYQQSDIATWAHPFYGPGYNPPLVDVNVDGGPLNPHCPVGDTCPPEFNGYAGDIEVDADIETQLAIVAGRQPPHRLQRAQRLHRPDRARRVDPDRQRRPRGRGQLQLGRVRERRDRRLRPGREHPLRADGRSRARACSGPRVTPGPSRASARTAPPSSTCIDPPVAAVGDQRRRHLVRALQPGHQPAPRVPGAGGETVWNVDNLCSRRSASAGQRRQGGSSGAAPRAPPAAAPASSGAGRPTSRARGSTTRSRPYGNGTTHCSLAPTGTPCREVPDISANADEFTPYAEYCTGSAATPVQHLRARSATASRSRLVRDRRHEPVVAAVVGDRRRPGQLPGPPHRQHQPAAVPAVPDRTRVATSTTSPGSATAPTNNGLFPTVPAMTWPPGSARSR